MRTDHKVLLVDDHKILLDGIKNLITNHELIAQVDTESQPIQAVEKIKRQHYDLLITDYEMPGITGVELIKLVRGHIPHIKVIVLSMYDDAHVIKKLVKLNVEGYILKKDTHSNLEMAIHQILRGKKYFSIGIDINEPAKKTSQKVELTSREKEVLKLIVKEYNNQEIADSMFISKRTVETHRKNMIKKINVSGTIGLVKYAYENELV